MAQAGYTPIQLYLSTTASAVPSAGNLANGELAINITDGKLFYKDNGGVVQVLATKGAGTIGGSNTQVQYNSSGALAGSANLTFDGTTLTAAGLAGPHNGTVGATTPNTGAFTTLSASSTVSGAGFSTYLASPPAIGGTAANTGAFTTLAASGAVTLSGGTANGVAYLNGSKVLTTGSALTFDGTTYTQTTTDGTTSTKWAAASGKLRLRPYADATNGAIFEATNVAESAYVPLSLFGSVVNLGGDTAIVSKIGGSEQMRLTSTGLGIGTSSPANLLTVQTAATGTTAGSNVIARLQSNATGRDATIQFSDNVSNSVTISQLSGATIFRQNGVESARIDSSGNFGIGTSSPVTKLDVNGDVTQRNGAGAIIGNIQNSSGWYDIKGSSNVNGVQLSTAVATPIRFLPNGAEAARIDSSGNLLVGTTSNSNGSKLVVSASGATTITSQRETTAAVNHVLFANPNGNVGTISTSGTSTAYNTSSDYRLKENIQPMTGALAKVAALKPVTYTWKADGSAGEGFIAHELAEVCPQAVTGEKDAVDAEGKPVYQGIDVSFLVGTLTAALQEAHGLIKNLETRLAALEAK